MRFTLPNDKAPKENTVFLGFQFRNSGHVVITATDDEGFVWNLLILNPDGTFSRVECIHKNIGFSVNSCGQIIEKEES